MEADLHRIANDGPGEQARTRWVDLAPFRDADLRILSGARCGRSARAATQLAHLDTDPEFEHVVIRVPEDTWDVTSSFWLGMFGESVRRLRADGFRARYEFRGGIHPDDVGAGIEDALFEENPLADVHEVGRGE